MALLTPLALDEARAIVARYGLSLRAIEPVPHGSVNSNFALELADEQRLFLRIYEESGPEEVARQNRLLAHLCARGVRTPAPLEHASGGTLDQHRGKPVALFPFCEGSWSCQAAVDEGRARAIGAELARVHLAGAGYEDAPPSRFGFGQLGARLDRLAHSAPAEIAALLPRLRGGIDELAATLAPAPDDHVIHGDLFRDNVLWHGSEPPWLLDFESASRGDVCFDLMVTMHAWCFGATLEQPLARALVAGYQSVRRLSDEEWSRCHAQARAAALRFAITRITDYELRPRGVVVYKDFRRFLARLDAVETIRPAAFRAFL